MKKSNKSDKIQGIMDEWLVNYFRVILQGGKNFKIAQTASFIN
jgi:hypothetical protein